ncbi:hypothetical protein ACROYT_G036904 [Oculina patagonica]
MESKLLILLVTIAVQFLLAEGRSCYFYDYTKPCTGSSCLDTTRCEHKNERCFSLYNVTSDGSAQVLQKGCWRQDNSCSLTNECVFRKLWPRSSLYFCCCTGGLCNSSITTENFTGLKQE